MQLFLLCFNHEEVLVVIPPHPKYVLTIPGKSVEMSCQSCSIYVLRRHITQPNHQLHSLFSNHFSLLFLVTKLTGSSPSSALFTLQLSLCFEFQHLLKKWL